MNFNAHILTREIKEYALKVGANLVGIVSVEDADSKPKIWVGWKIQSYTKRLLKLCLKQDQ